MERDIAAWKDYLRAHGNLSEEDVTELEDHLRNEISDLETRGLSGEEAFIIGVRRTGKVSKVAAEFAKVSARTLWKQLLLEPAGRAELKRARRETLLVAGLALLAGLLSRVPEFFGIKLSGDGSDFYIRNISFLILPAVTAYFAWKFPGRGFRVFLFFVISACSAALANVFPAYSAGDFDILIGIHVPILLWISAGAAYAGSGWRGPDGRMDFIRFSGEAFIYLVLILCGGGVLVATAAMLFQAIGYNVEVILGEYVAVIGASAAPVVAVYLAAAKRNVIENIAPVLARVFSPLFLLLLTAFTATILVTRRAFSLDRDILIGFDLLLVLVLGMVLYTISARDEKKDPGFNDYLQAALIIAALVVDTIALAAILARIGNFGITPNKTAALGENILLLVNLAVSAVLYIRFFRKKEGYRSLVTWQTKFLPVFALWAAAVAFVFPVIFR